MQASQRNRAGELMREARQVASATWWRFFDWLAVTEWRQLIIIWLLALAAFGMLQTPEPALWFMLMSFAVKVLAGGKRKAELEAAAAGHKADVATL